MKILYVANVHRHFNAFHKPYIKWLRENGHEVHVVANGDDVVSDVDKKYVINIQRSPYRFANISAYMELKRIIEKEKYDVVHCHTPMGGILGRLASKGCRKNGTKVIYTSHGFHFCKGCPIKNWILYYPIERFMARYTDVIITINEEDFKLAQNLNIESCYYIPGIGLDIETFKNCINNKNLSNKRSEIGVRNDEELLLISVGDLSNRKNHKIVIKALKGLKDLKFKYIICGSGDQESNLKALVRSMKLEDDVIFLGHRADVRELLEVSDIFIFPSLWEGLGIAGIEAMAACVPVIASDRHGIKDYAIHNETALLCDPKNDTEFTNAIIRIAQDKKLVDKLTTNAYKKIEAFDLSKSMLEMIRIYKSVF